MNIQQQLENLQLAKSKKDVKYEQLTQTYLHQILAEYKSDHKVYNYLNLNESTELKDKAGVYLMFAEQEKNIIFTYVGESTKIWNRFKRHLDEIKKGNKKLSLYKKINYRINTHNLKLEDIKFIVIADNLEDENQRLALEVWNIYKTKTKNYSMNSKICSRRLKCPLGHGVCRTKMQFVIDDNQIKMIISGISKSKKCKERFLITETGNIILKNK
ncbi:hypothetical protein [Spiroplasma endosymbiont of Crioceris asparagi]|uniref:hypothetical protein n=1 Tax=Spiroplasma endosymbiont of Crioceris asparagi TaxID=3066286 RepID=UPI0030CD3D56